MATFVLVHGAWHAGWCWQRIAPALRERGHAVIVVDLPGHGDDRTPVGEVSFDAYVERICDHVLEATEPVVLVGHSLAGMSITQAAERLPDRIARLVYVGAFLPANGMSIPLLASTDFDRSLVLVNQIVDEDLGQSTIVPDGARETFYAQCTDEDVASCIGRLQPESLLAQTPAVSLTDERAGRVPRTYIETLQDRAIPLEKQRAMQVDVPCDRVFQIDADHSPFFSRPAELVTCLLETACDVDRTTSRQTRVG